MASEWIELLLRANVALAAGIALVMVLRPIVRKRFGARIGYALWLLPLAATAMCFAPARVEHVVLEPITATADLGSPGIVTSAEAAATQPPYLLWAWIAGAIVSVVVLAMRQARFTMALGRLSKRDDLGRHVRAAESCEHGPAVIGVLRPIIVTPADFEQRFDAEERRIVLAHERAHLAQGDPWINALVVLLQCVNWFNPFVHIGARALRIDQELACDATVLAQSDGLRRRYAEAILKTHIAAAVPIGCSWPPSDLNALKERISMLKRNLPSRTQTLIGGVAVIAITAGVAAAAWAAQPTRVVTTIASSQEAPATVMLADADAEATADLESLDALHALASLESLGSLETLASLESLSALSALEALPEDHELEGRGVHVMRDGRTVRYEDLSPEERAEVRRELAEAREHIREAREASNEARAEARERAAEAREAAQEAREAARAAQHARGDDQREAEREAREMHLEALQEEREARAEAAQIRAEVMAEMRIAMAEMERELAQLGPQERAYARDALREAHSEIARELSDARRRGDADEIQALEAAEQALRGAAHD
ncbi:MAG: M56 family metallopeptidase [Hyphomonadaceae bacterium]|nr:M56 family metallopeptidase [Hyphomonadaceae bacterium]